MSIVPPSPEAGKSDSYNKVEENALTRHDLARP